MPAMPHTLRALVFILGGAAVLAAAALAMVIAAPPAPALLIPLIPALAAWYLWDRPRELRRERRAKGLCVRCGYDLRGNVSGVCPECGEGCARRLP
jgi:hypothetical protein